MDYPLPAVDTVSVVSADGTDVAIANVGGTVHAFADTCTHRECPLSEGTIDAVGVTCPCHKSRFDLVTGEALNGPATQPVRIWRAIVEGERVSLEG